MTTVLEADLDWLHDILLTDLQSATSRHAAVAPELCSDCDHTEAAHRAGHQVEGWVVILGTGHTRSYHRSVAEDAVLDGCPCTAFQGPDR